jgi:hypothetical protein
MAQTGKGADDGGVVYQHILRKWRAVPALHDRHRRDACVTGLLYRATRRVAPTFIQSYPFWLYYVERKGFEYFRLLTKTHP